LGCICGLFTLAGGGLGHHLRLPGHPCQSQCRKEKWREKIGHNTATSRIRIGRRMDNRMTSLPQLYSIDLGTFRVALLICKPGLKVHLTANIPGTSVHLVHIPEHDTFWIGSKQQSAPSCQAFFSFFHVSSSAHVWQSLHAPCK
jgi:hypothetical protein